MYHANAQLSVTLFTSNYNGSNISCFGMQDGSITANPTGGTPPYTYLWSNQETGQTISSLAAGYYRVEVKDDLGAIVYGEVTLTEPEALQLSPVVNIYSNGYNISCYNCFNGSIALTISGGIAPYTHLWSDGSTQKNRWSLGPGNISVVITDANGCEVNSETMYLNQPERSDWTMTGNAGSNASTNFIGTTDNTDLVFKTNNAERLRIKPNGNVTINGTLNVNDSITLNSYRQIGYRAAQGSDPEIMSFGKAPVILPPAITLCADPNLTPAVYQFNGIIQSYGTATYNSVSQLNSMVMGFDGANGIIEAAGVTPYPQGNNILLNYYCGHDVGVGNLTSGDLIANHNVKVRGIVGVGTDNPSAKLDIAAPATSTDKAIAITNGSNIEFLVYGNGHVYARDVTVKTGTFPDYVFAPEYKLLSLEAIAQFINDYKHLPELPTAAEVEANGLTLGDVQTVLVKKVEELTLYLIDQNKRVKQLEETNKALSKELGKLKSSLKK